MKIDDERVAITFDDVLIVPSYSTVESRSDIDNLAPKNNKLGVRLPFISANMDTITGLSMAKTMADSGACGFIHRNMHRGELEHILDRWLDTRSDNIVISTGVICNNGAEQDRIDTALLRRRSNIILCVDIAHGDSKNMTDTLEYIRKKKEFDGTLVAGNVCTLDAVRRLASFGADIVKVGIGGGSVCSTRVETGCGVPQLQAIIDCSKYPDIPIIADGGIRNPGDACKALAAGASYVMIGGMLAGTDSAESQSCYRGMASNEAQGGCAPYVEGVSFEIKSNKGKTVNVIRRLESGLRSSMSYVGVSNLEDFQKFSKFIRVSQNTAYENKPHFTGV
jgi:IMP dehydrogenase